MARSAGVPHAVTVETFEELDREMDAAFTAGGCRFVDVRTAQGHARVPPRQTDGFEDKYRFVRYVEQLEGVQILGLARQDRQLMKQSDAD